MKLTKLEIDGAIACDRWQKFRVSLKGKSTAVKLNKLYDYLNQEECSTCTYGQRRVQVLNYLNALARGGQIEPLGDKFSFAYDWRVRVVIKS